MEIERKFWLKELPELEPYQTIDVLQGYLSTSPEVRIRSFHVLSGEQTGHKDYKMTIKGDGDLSREEIEFFISEDIFNSLAHFIEARYGKLIHKIFRKYRIGGHIFECSVVDPDSIYSFIYGEVEFPDEQTALDYICPFPGALDVTYEPKWKMKNYWVHTRIENHLFTDMLNAWIRAGMVDPISSEEIAAGIAQSIISDLKGEMKNENHLQNPA